MPTICPNCLRPVRPDAKYCGYCGTNLNPNAHDDPAAVQASYQEAEVNEDNSTKLTRSKSKGGKIRRIVLIVVIILLCLVLLTAFLIHYWPIITPFFGALISMF
jgi:fatty acid desaturase